MKKYYYCEKCTCDITLKVALKDLELPKYKK